MSRYRTTNAASRRYSNQMPMRDSVKYDTKAHDNYDRFPLGMAYVPWQTWNEVYEIDKAFHTGTIFPELDKGFYCAGGGCR